MTSRPRLAALLMSLLLLASAATARALDTTGLTHIDGGDVGSAELPENAILIFFASWSPRCRGIVERANRIEKEWGGIAPVFLIDFQEDVSAVEDFLAGKSPRAKILLDRRAVFSKDNNITSLPGLLAFKDGTAAFRGKLPADANSVLRPIFE